MKNGTNTFNKTKTDISNSTKFINILSIIIFIIISIAIPLFFVGGELDEDNAITFLLIASLLFLVGGLLFGYAYVYIVYVFYCPNIIIRNPIIEDDLNYVIEKYLKQSDKQKKIMETFLLRGVLQPFSIIKGTNLVELFLILTDEDLTVYRNSGLVGFGYFELKKNIEKCEKCETFKYNEIININLTNTTINAYSVNYKFFIMTLRNGESIQMLACDYDGKLQEKYENFIKVINERKGD